MSGSISADAYMRASRLLCVAALCHQVKDFELSGTGSDGEMFGYEPMFMPVAVSTMPPPLALNLPLPDTVKSPAIVPVVA